MMSSSANSTKASHFAAALLGCTILAGMPASAMAQDAEVQAEAEAIAPADAQSESSPAPAATQEQGDVIRTITVAGAQRLEPDTIISYIQLRVGQVYTAERADQALVDLAATELFADFGIENNDGNILITVEENPIINRIIFEGNRRLDDDEIVEEINLFPRQIFTRSRVRADVARIIELYKRQGRYAAVVEPQMVMLDQNRVDVIYEITEGPKSKVRQINIIGNEAFSDGDLRGEMVTKEAGFFKIFSSNTSYDPDRLQYDQQLLRQYYLTEGYADFRVVSAVAELTPDKRDFIITYVLEEGERYQFGNVEVISQLRDFDSDLLTASLGIKEGDWYNATLVDDTIERLTETAGTYGYAFAQVRPEFFPDRETRTMDVRFTLTDAPRVYVEEIDINGNTITQDKVIRREFRIVEGDAFSSLQVQRSTARINSLGYFQENFEIEQVEGSAPDRIILQANLQEEPTGELSLSAGFSSLESFIFQGSIRQNNFRGRGQTVGLSLNYSRYSRSGSVSFTEPYLFDRNIFAGVDIYRQDYNNGYFNRESATYDQSTTGISFRAGVPLTEYLSVIGRYTLNFENVTIDESLFFDDFDGDGVSQCEPILAGRYLCEAIGKRTQSILGLSMVYNTLDSRLRPTRGEVAGIDVQFAGLGGSTRYLRASANAAKYWNLGSQFIFSVRAEAGAIHGLGQDVRLTDRFFLGEPDMRGFDIRGIGPRVVRRPYIQNDEGELVLRDLDDKANQDDALGGKYYYFGRAELEIPLGTGARELGLRPSIFVDIGSVFGIETPTLVQSPPPDGLFIPRLNEDGLATFQQFVRNDAGDVTGVEVVTNPIAPDGSVNTPIGRRFDPFQEDFFGDSPKPRLSVGIGVNWNSPFGPFRIDLAHTLLKQEGDETKILSFNVGTAF
ncbi:outer membrane protein assembly factor BamA [Alteraurantiacibacter aquimixticola]|uniref:Outer membrane protein assembly factor BamA n=1 Tax=Alteraurantiacibacter aquimixticola TaxID=2489173 RepID=A0A4T3F3X0_9SPHN|nr:outer membrane protein assembly factor BamA [Alteraurantiacibacter aquimixticola]TIX51943.1 outer membrane protein assembly factor BamA [Alteraurantiacibacter aquimixticola]